MANYLPTRHHRFMSSKLPRILVTDPIDTVGINTLRSSGYEVDVASPPLSQKELISRLPEYEGIIVRSNTLLNREVIQAGTQLRVIGRAGTGVDNIDLIEATKQSILVMNTPCGNTVSTAELTMGLLTKLAREHSIAGVHGKTIGLIGLGRVGTEVAKRCIAFGMNVLVYDPFLSNIAAKQMDVEPVSLADVCARSDFISLHCPLTYGTTHLLNAARLMRCKEGVYLINTSRAGLMDLNAVLEGVESGKIEGTFLARIYTYVCPRSYEL